MFRIPSYAMSILICLVSSCTRAGGTQSQVASPIIVLEATGIYHGLGFDQDKHLLVRLTSDRRVDWDKPVGGAWEPQTSFVSAEVASEIERTLDTVYKGSFRGTMGPYYVYEDTSVDLQIRIIARKREITFQVTNPWSSGRARKHMPKDMKTVVCEINSLEALIANGPIDQQCKGRNPSQ